MDELTVSQFISGLVVFAIVAGGIASVRRRSEDAAVYILGGLVIVGALWSGSKSGIGAFITGLVGFTFLAVFLWLISGMFTPHD